MNKSSRRALLLPYGGTILALEGAAQSGILAFIFNSSEVRLTTFRRREKNTAT
jgi:hypothetical protein